MSFSSSFDAGMQGMNAALAGQRAQQQVGLEKQRLGLESARAEIQNRLDEQRLDALKTELLAHKQQQDAEMIGLAEANGAYNDFQQERSQLDPAAPDYVDRVTQLKTKYMPAMAKNAGVAAKFDALDRFDRSTDTWVNRSIILQQLAAKGLEASEYGLGAQQAALRTEVQSGRMTPLEALGNLSDAVDTEKQQRAAAQRDFEIAKAKAPAEVRGGVRLWEDENGFLGRGRGAVRQGDLTENTRDKLNSLYDLRHDLDKRIMNHRLERAKASGPAALAKWESDHAELNRAQKELDDQIKAISSPAPSSAPSPTPSPSAPQGLAPGLSPGSNPSDTNSPTLPTPTPTQPVIPPAPVPAGMPQQVPGTKALPMQRVNVPPVDYKPSFDEGARQAREAIRMGKDPRFVHAEFRRLYGQDFPF